LRLSSDHETVRKSRHNYFPGADATAVTLLGPGTVSEIELRLESVDPEILANTWIAVAYDGASEPSVLAPIGAFFGAAGQDTGDHSSVVVGRIDGRMWCRFPMPFQKQIDIRFVNKTAQIADIAYWVTWRKGAAADAGYFHARHNASVTEEGKPFIAANISGNGHYVGTTLAAKNADSLTILEGDDAFLVDGAAADSFHGTGTDDYVNGGWYFADGAASGPMNAVTLKDAEAPVAFMAFRSHLTEPVPFTQSFVFELEHGPKNDRPGVAYESVAYWYQTPGAMTTQQLAKSR